jgi:hypothetical protein
MTSTSDELRVRFGAVYTAALTDVLDDLGRRHQTLPSAVGPLEPGARVAGPVFAVEGRTNHSIDPETSIRRILEMLGPPATSRSTSRVTRPAPTSASSPRPHCWRTESPVS